MYLLSTTRWSTKLGAHIISNRRDCSVAKLDLLGHPSRRGGVAAVSVLAIATISSQSGGSGTVRAIILPARNTPGSIPSIYASGISRGRYLSNLASTAVDNMKTLPQPPLYYYQPSTVMTLLDLSDLTQVVEEQESRRQKAYDLSRHIQVAVTKARHQLMAGITTEALNPIRVFAKNRSATTDHGNDSATNSCESKEWEDLLYQPERLPRQPRLANLSHRMEDILRLESFQYFLLTGQLIPLSVVVEQYACTDEEYLTGAILGLATDLVRYGLGRATVRDTTSVQLATDVVRACQQFLLQLDFRNGPLRRRFDGNKYNLNALETLLYELAITSTTTGNCHPTGGDSPGIHLAEPEPKRVRNSNETDDDGDVGDLAATDIHKDDSRFPIVELESLRQRMEYRDELRERLIKLSRDSQKASKQAIFALHRGDAKRCYSLLDQCQHAIRSDLLPLTCEDPTLRTGGSLSGVLEEYIEARLFATWLHGFEMGGDQNRGDISAGTMPKGVLLKPSDFSDLIDLEAEEYLGGLCDLTGEIGRYAVQQGTIRNVEAVRLCLQTNDAILTALHTIGRLPGLVSKKLPQVQRGVEKLERMLYEISLSEATGGRQVITSVDDIKVGEADDEEDKGDS